MFERARDYGESALYSMGLQPRRTAIDYLLPALGLFGMGMLVGVGLGFVIAPKRGTELRSELGRGMRNVGARLRQRHRQGQRSEPGDGHDEEYVESEASAQAEQQRGH